MASEAQGRRREGRQEAAEAEAHRQMRHPGAQEGVHLVPGLHEDAVHGLALGGHVDGLKGGAEEDRLLPAPGLETFFQEFHGSETASSQAMEKEY